MMLVLVVALVTMLVLAALVASAVLMVENWPQRNRR